MFKLRTLTAAVSLAAAGFIAAPVHAVIDDANMGQFQGNLFTGNSGAGEVFVSIVARDAANPAQNQSYVRDLGVTATQFFDDVQSMNGLTFAPDASLTGFLAGNAGKDINFQITGVQAPDKFNFTFFTVEDAGFTVSAAPGVDVASLQPNGDTAFNGPSQDFDNWLGQVNLSNSGVPTGGNPTLTPAQIAQNDSGTFAVGDLGFHDAPNWGSSPFGFNGEGDIGGAVDFWFIGLENTDNTVSRDPIFLGQWTLDAAGTLAFQAVPVPAAVWMFGSALFGLAGARRRARA